MILSLQQSRRLVSRFGAAVGIIFLLSVIDTFVSGHLQPKNVLQVLVGTHQAVSGDLSTPVREAAEVRYFTKAPVFRLQVVEAKGRVWRGILEAPLGATPGSYDLQVFSAFESTPEKSAPLKVMIFDSEQALRASYLSITRKLLGIAPWWISISSLPLLIAALIISFRISTLQEVRLMRQGLVPIIKMARRKDHWEITAEIAGLASRSKITVGDTLDLVDPEFHKMADMVVEKVTPDIIQGRAALQSAMRPDGYVHLPRGGSCHR
jgi:hypothetical protein